MMAGECRFVSLRLWGRLDCIGYKKSHLIKSDGLEIK